MNKERVAQELVKLAKSLIVVKKEYTANESKYASSIQREIGNNELSWTWDIPSSNLGLRELGDMENKLLYVVKKDLSKMNHNIHSNDVYVDLKRGTMTYWQTYDEGFSAVLIEKIAPELGFR